MTQGRKGRTAQRGKGRPTRGQSGVGRDAVLAAAEKLMRQYPSSALTRAEFARLVGVDPALIRYYFTNMSSLLTEGMHAIFKDLQERRDDLEPTASFRLQLQRRISSLIEVLEANPQLHQLVMEPVMHVEPDKVEEVVELRRDYTQSSFRSFESLLSTAQENGESRDLDAVFLYITMIGVSNFAVRCHQYFEMLPVAPGTREQILSRYAEFVADLLIDGLRPRS